MLAPLSGALDVADFARASTWDVHHAALLLPRARRQLGLDALREAARGLVLDQHWDRLVARRAAEDLSRRSAPLGRSCGARDREPPKSADAAWADQAVQEWMAGLGAPAKRARAAFAELDAQGPWTFAKLMLASAELNALATSQR